jgi:hypothetical protein
MSYKFQTTHPPPAVASLDIALRLRLAKPWDVPATLDSMIESCFEPDSADRPEAAVPLHSLRKAGHRVI